MGLPTLIQKRTAVSNTLPTVNLGGTNLFSFAAVPGDCAVVKWASIRSAGPRNITSITGLGATWSRIHFSGISGFNIVRIEAWLGVGVTTDGDVAVTQNNSGEAHFTVYAIRNLKNPSHLSVGGNAGYGQFALNYAAAYGVITIPSGATNPATGFTFDTASIATAGSAGGSYRIPTEIPAVTHNVNTSGGSAPDKYQLVLGDFVPPLHTVSGNLVQIKKPSGWATVDLKH